jgi:cytoskeletal protein RodZ
MNIGLTLKNKRKQLNISLERAHKETKISSKFLEGLENNDHSVFPAKLYLVGSIKKYCAYLGMDSAEILKLLFGEKIQPAPEPAKPQQVVVEENKHQVVNDDIIKGGIIFASVIIAIATALYVFGFYVNSVYKSNKNKMDQMFSKTPFIKSTFMESFDLPEKLELKATAVERVWMEIKEQDTLLYEGYLDKGKEVAFTAHTFFNLFVDKPSSLVIKMNTLNVNNAEIFQGDVKTAKLTKEYFKELRRLATLRGTDVSIKK